ncbi:MAG: hypothetical protein GF315_09275 [candidate division Zixibacteria bacterium]|nr:hypothetical protein [candidate division Zixibacteria bacterium]
MFCQGSLKVVTGALIGLMFVIIVLPTISFAGNGEFNVDSFIPEKFVDLEWKVNGSLNLTGEDDESKEYGGQNHNYFDWSEDSDNRQFGNLSSYLNYRYHTVEREFNARLNLNTIYYQTKTDDSGLYVYNDNDTTVYIDNGFREEYQYNIYPTIEGTQYLTSDLYVYTDFTSNISILLIPRYNRSRSSVRTYFSLYPDSTIFIDKRISENRNQEDRHETDVSFDYQLATGWGRVYEGEFASTAMYIIDELKKEGMLARSPSYEEMLEMTNIIYQYRLKHTIDNRIHKIETIESIGNYLMDRGILSESTPLTTMIIQDVWSYIPVFNRRFGYKIQIGGGYGYSHARSDTRSWEEDFRLYYEYFSYSPDDIDTTHYDIRKDYMEVEKISDRSLPYLTASFSYYKPFNHRWQLDLNLDGSYYLNGYSKGKRNVFWYAWMRTERKVEFDKYYTLDFRAILRYIINSRTYSHIECSLDYAELKSTVTDKSDSAEEVYNGLDGDDFSYEIELGLTYRIAIPTSLELACSYYSRDYEIDNFINYESSLNSSRWRKSQAEGFSVEASISHYIF